MATLKDVAKLAGVSATTVSIVINGKAQERRISKETQDRVFTAVKQLNYKPNLNARKLRFKDGSKPSIAFYWPLDYRTSILAHFLNSMQKEIQMHNLEWDFVVQTYENDKLERDASSFSNNIYNAAIIGAASFNDVKFLESLNPSMPIVLINRESDMFSTVSTDNQEMGFQAARLFRDKGYREATVVTSLHSYVATGLRTQSFLYACAQLGINVQSKHIIKEYSTISGGARAAQIYCQMSDAPKAIFFESDSMAIGALHTFHHNHIRIPEDVEILTIGLLSPESTALTFPSLSVVEMPHILISKLIIETLSEKLSKNTLIPSHHRVPANIVLRESFIL